MVDFKSDLTGASQKATALKKATDSLSQSNSVSTDNQTTIVGNKTAHEVIQTAQLKANEIAEAIQVASSNIQTVAQDFDAMDREAAKILRSTIGRDF